MSMKEMKLLQLLCEKIGIKTTGDLEAFKKYTDVTTNDDLIKRLALYVAIDINFKELMKNE